MMKLQMIGVGNCLFYIFCLKRSYDSVAVIALILYFFKVVGIHLFSFNFIYEVEQCSLSNVLKSHF